MKLLAIDTSSDACSVALGIDDEIHEEHVVEPREHTRILIPMISRLLDQQGLRVVDLDAIVLGNGPGSFIGIRIGASVVQGLAFAANLPIVPVSSMTAIGLEAIRAHGAERVAVAQDARMSEVYLGLFRRDADDMPAAMSDASIVSVDGLSLIGGPFVAAGDAWNRYPVLVSHHHETIERVLPIRHPRAGRLLEIGAARPGDAVAPGELEPAYLRSKVASIPPPRH